MVVYVVIREYNPVFGISTTTVEGVFLYYCDALAYVESNARSRVEFFIEEMRAQ